MEIAGKTPVVYAGPRLAPVAYKWKISFNENAKNIAWWNSLPEFNHNEFMGWTSHPIEKPYTVIDLRSDLEHPQIQKRFELTDKLLSGRRPAAQVVQAEGQGLLQQLVWATAFGDFVSIYLALLNNVNPTPIDLIEKFKAELNA
jgi:glucose/mannose-6-phosphate isomerase